MTTLLKPLLVRETLIEKKVRTFTPHDFERIFGVTPTRAKYFLETQTGEGLLIRLKKGLYALKTDRPTEEEIANSLYRPSYISFEYALAFWGILPEMPYAVTSATTKPTRQFSVNSIAFDYYSIKKEAYTGYRLLKARRRVSPKDDNVNLSETEIWPTIGGFLMAEPEKALVDYLYFVALGKREDNDRLYINLDTLDVHKIWDYAKLYDRKRLNQLLKDIL